MKDRPAYRQAAESAALNHSHVGNLPSFAESNTCNQPEITASIESPALVAAPPSYSQRRAWGPSMRAILSCRPKKICPIYAVHALSVSSLSDHFVESLAYAT